MDLIALSGMVTLINDTLKKEFLCIPPYQYNQEFLLNLKKKITNQSDIVCDILAEINNPHRRAYQMEYRYKKSKSFSPYLSIIEYATFDALNGNYICAYLSLIPVAEALLREWLAEHKLFTFDEHENKKSKIKNEFKAIINTLKLNISTDINVANSMNIIIDGYLDFFLYIFNNFYARFEDYKKEGFQEVFNRNLSLHTLEGVNQCQEGHRNVTRMFLFIDVIAELYMMQESKTYWENIFNIDSNLDLDFKLRYNLYLKLSIQSVIQNDIFVIQNLFLKKSSAIEKNNVTQKLKNEIKQLQNHDIKL